MAAKPKPEGRAGLSGTAAGPLRVGTAPRPRLMDLEMSHGKRVRLTRMLYEHGPGGGTLLILPIDQGLEHGPVDFFSNPDSLDPDYEFRLALEGNFSAIALHIGLAEKYLRQYAGRVPLILKINGKTNIPSDAIAFSPLTATVEDAVRLGADAVGYTLYVGSPGQDRDIAQAMQVRADCERYGMPLVVWAYPRGEAISKKGGRDSLYAVEYAARVAQEIGADIVKVNYPVPGPNDKDAPAPYNQLLMTKEEMFQRVVRSAGRTMVLVSGGEKMGDDELISKVRSSLQAGATGIIFGRNLWQRGHAEALAITSKIQTLFREYGEHPE